MSVTVLSVALLEDGAEFVVDPGEGVRQGVSRGISYFVDKESEEFGGRLDDLLMEIQGFAEDVHYTWKRLPRGGA